MNYPLGSFVACLFVININQTKGIKEKQPLAALNTGVAHDVTQSEAHIIFLSSVPA